MREYFQINFYRNPNTGEFHSVADSNDDTTYATYADRAAMDAVIAQYRSNPMWREYESLVAVASFGRVAKGKR